MNHLTGGLTDPAPQSAAAFRIIMQAMARPGTIHRLTGGTAPAPVGPAAATALLVLCDPTTPLHLAGAADHPSLRNWVSFHTGAPLTDAETAQFAHGRWDDLMPLDRFPVGLPDYPDRSATLIVELDALDPTGTRLTGPGIQDAAHLSLPAPDVLAANAARFPLGLDFIFTCGDRLACLPRSTQLGDV
ncbi:phosphonate C-P lyase system protein PhnH [Paracoccus sp. (in: a-proteobacteria)]|uniref:phosphonate C-P lyase system protein PhnH n=1 Tax=Paracoccus sp. TaxID=267 RepID=UPI0026E0C0C1|nr:phosphonate C-P lyase system protein PhnH [Paracoccus sp. (in: a-proteobacteria)]MDO5648287.1 phosphonate C-P lyase system protein PhnH [Paracoccus sp. (in: a-proteobacteria)]